MKHIFTVIIFAFLISIIIHLLLFDFINKKLVTRKVTYPTSNIQKKSSLKKDFSNIKFVKLQTKIQKKIPVRKKLVEKKQMKKQKPIINKGIKKILKPTKKLIVKQIPKTIKLPKIQKTDLKKFFTISKQDLRKRKKKKKKQEREEKEIYKERNELKHLDKVTQSYIKLYGNTYFTLSKEQKTYLKNNLSKIAMITQRYLTYPALSIRTRQSGTNIIEFILHPNGDISHVRLTGSSNYTALDQNTIETIQLAYKDYPRPTKATLIKIYVQYILN